MRIVFVILHYMAEEETYKSVEMIQKNIDTKEYHIVIVDNASPDGSGERIQSRYSDVPKITLLKSESNLGFAKGNNLGFAYAKKKWDVDFIVLMNNDVYLLEEHLVGKLEKEHQKYGFAVLGPLIMTADGRCDINPIRFSPADKGEILRDLKLYKRELFLWKYHLMGICLKAMKVKAMLMGKPSTGALEKRKKYLEHVEDVQLHGCFLVFSKEYIEQFEGLDGRTFLFREEAILYKHMLEHNMKTIYCPDILIFHKEDASTDMVVGSGRKKMMFMLSHHLKSLKVLLDIYESYDTKSAQ